MGEPMTPAPTTATACDLAPHHLADLRRSGLTDATIAAANIRSVTREEGRNLLGFDPRSASYVIPYPKRGDFPDTLRVRLDEPYVGEDGKKRKYLAPKDAANRLYIPASLNVTDLQSKRIPFWIVEGEKKALKAAQEGLCCVGLSGVWNWRWRDDALHDSRTISDFGTIWLKGRAVRICLDSDLATKPGVAWAEYKLALKLRELGAEVVGVRLPAGPSGEKVGIDDYLVSHTVEDLERLPTDPLTERPDRRTTTILNDGPSAPRLADLLDEVAGLIDNYTTMPRDGLSMLIAAWIASTYTFKRFRYCGYLRLRSATPRCGKSRLLSLVAAVSNGEPPVTSAPSAALLIRRTRPVLLLDEVDRLRNADKETYGDVLGVLNVGFEAGGTFEKLEKAKGGQWEVKAFPVYGPVALAGLEHVADTLADRAFSIQMKRAPKRLPRLNRRRLTETAQRVRQDFEVWASRRGDDIEKVYAALPDEVPILATFDDRFQDIAEPLVVLASVADDERGNDAPPVLPRLLRGLRAAAGHREPSGRERELAAFLDLVEDRLPGTAEDVFIASADLLEAFREHPDLSRIESGRSLAGLLKNFELYAGTNSAKTTRGYTVTRAWIEEWRTRYHGSSAPSEGEGSCETPLPPV